VYYRARPAMAGTSSWSGTSGGCGAGRSVLAGISNPEKDGEYLVDWGDVTGATDYELQ